MVFFLLALAGCGALLLACSFQSGTIGNGEPTLQSANFTDGQFHNLHPTRVSASNGEMFKATVEYFTGDQLREPEGLLPTTPVNVGQLGKNDTLRVTWLGHSTCLIEIDGRIIITDPVFSDRASPFSFIGPKRFASNLPIRPEDLPQLDAVVISHDHYDHLDQQSILALREKAARFYVPLGIGAYLKRWGVAAGKIIELDWWQERQDGSLTFTATPAQHFSGRSLSRNNTLWASWVIAGKHEKIFFSGDSGYFDGFRTIGEKYGPFDITMLESGAYNKAWSDIHMMPEQTVQAHIDLRGTLLLPIHWGKFNLSLHSWTEPVERLLAAANTKEVIVTTPLQGEPVSLASETPKHHWWAEVAQNPHN